MPFSETIKLSVKRSSHFTCCLCKTLGVEIHHIVPQEENGPDTEGNAAPLCPTCHEIYGANPQKRKFIKEARDFWYELCASRYKSDQTQLDEIRGMVEQTFSKSDFSVFAGEIFHALERLQKKSINFESAKQDLSPSSQAIRTISIQEFIGWLYSTDFGDCNDHFDILFDSRTWLDPEYEMVDYRRIFLEIFGSETAKRLCIYLQADEQFDFSGFTEEQFASLIGGLHVTVLLMVEIINGSAEIEMGLDDNGTLHWYANQQEKNNDNVEA